MLRTSPFRSGVVKFIGILAMASLIGCGGSGGGGGGGATFVSPTGDDVNGTGGAGDPFATIAAALLSLGGGGTIQLTAGTFTEDIVVPDGVRLVGDSEATTTLVGTGAGPVVQFDLGVSNLTSVEALTVQGGVGDVSGVNPIGSGIHIESGSPTISAVTVTGTTTSGPQGAAVVVLAGSSVMTNLTIDQNVGNMHGLFVSDTGVAVTTNLVATNNGGDGVNVSGSGSASLTSATVSTNGGNGISMSDTSAVTVTGATIDANTTGVDALSGTFSGSEMVVTNHTVAGISSSGTADVDLVNILIYDNATGISTTHTSGTFRANHATITENTVGLNDTAVVDLAVYNAIFWNNSTSDVLGTFTATTEAFHCDGPGFTGNNNLNSQDPVFFNAPADDFHLLVTSPCRDQGTVAGLPSTGDDLDGNVRFQFGTAPDMGALEQTSTAPWVLASGMPGGVLSGDIQFSIFVADMESDLADVLIEVKGGPVPSFVPMTIRSASSGTVFNPGQVQGLATVPTGMSHQITWDSISDIVTPTVNQTWNDIIVRVTPSDQLLGSPVELQAMTVHNSPAVPDQFEENDTNVNSVAIAPGNYTNLTVWKQDDDWYHISVPAGGSLQVDITCSDINADVDIFLYDPSGTEIMRGFTVTCTETVFVNSAPAGVYKFMVNMWNGSDSSGAHYDMTVTLIP